MQTECYTRSEETTACPLTGNIKSNYYAKLGDKKVSDNKLSWKVSNKTFTFR